MEIIFSSFWTWIGTIILIYTILGGIAKIIETCHRNRKITIVRIGDSYRVEIENATKLDVQNAIEGKEINK